MHHIAPFILVPVVFFVLFLTLLISVSVYLAPTFSAFFLRHPRRWFIAVLNVLFGWSVIGWFILIVWAWAGDEKKAKL